jgi:hypothetical protein
MKYNAFRFHLPEKVQIALIQRKRNATARSKKIWNMLLRAFRFHLPEKVQIAFIRSLPSYL